MMKRKLTTLFAATMIGAMLSAVPMMAAEEPVTVTW